MARSGTPTKPRTAQAKAVKPIRALKKTKSHRVRNIICGFLAGILSIAALLGTVSHILPAEIQAWPYVPIIVSLVPWFAILAVIALICGIVSKRTMSVLLAIAAIALQVWWQYPFFYNETKLPRMRRWQVQTACMAMVCGRRVRLLIRLMMMLIRARRSCQEPRLHSMMVGRRSVSFRYIPRLRPMDIGSSGSVHWMSLVDSGTIRLAGTCSWVISTRPTTIRRSVISWEHGSRMRPNKRPGDWCSRGLRISIMCRRLRALTISYWIPACWPVGSNR